MCPNCGKGTQCGCNSCVSRNGRNENTEIWDKEKDVIICPHCKQGFNINIWEDVAYEEYKKSQIAENQIEEKNID